MNVWRIQCECEDGHGPVSTSLCTRKNGIGIDDPRPNYGYIGKPPMSINPEERCGTTTEQFPTWWGRKVNFIGNGWDWEDAGPDVPDVLPEGWNAVLFDVPDDAARIDRGQVVFKIAKAREIFRTRTDFPR